MRVKRGVRVRGKILKKLEFDLKGGKGERSEGAGIERRKKQWVGGRRVDALIGIVSWRRKSWALEVRSKREREREEDRVGHLKSRESEVERLDLKNLSLVLEGLNLMKSVERVLEGRRWKSVSVFESKRLS